MLRKRSATVVSFVVLSATNCGFSHAFQLPVLLVVPLPIHGERRFIYTDEVHEERVTPPQDPATEGDPLDLRHVAQLQSLRRLVVHVPEFLDTPDR